MEEVSIVDRPANKRVFLMVKSEGGEMGDRTEIEINEDGSLTTGAPDPGAPAEEPIDLAFAFAEAGEVIATVQKAITLPGEFRDTIFQNLYKTMRQMSAVLSMTEIARPDDATKSQLAPILMGELDEVSKSIGALIKALAGGKVKKDEGDDEESVEKAVWTTAQINEFPDSSFLYVKPGGKKDAAGKTVPRTNRMFPVRDAQGNLDIPHLRNAIARAPQANIPADVKTKVQEQARRLLAEAQKAKFAAKTKKAEEPPPPPPAALVALVERAEAIATEVEKRGAKMSKTRLARFKEAITVLQSILGELGDGGTPATPPPKNPKVSKSDEDTAKAMADLTANVEKLTAVVKSQSDEIKSLRAARPVSNAIPVDRGAEPKDGGVRWPSDMAK